MKKYRKQGMLIIAALCVLGFAHAQESVTTTGGNVSGTGGSISYSVGQVFYTIATGTNGSVVQGVQQPYEISEVTGIEEAKDINLSISVYPNPTNDFLTLELDAERSRSTQSMSYQLYDINGKLLQSEKITGNQTNIVMSEFAVATYFVKVIQGNKEIKTFKIIKK